MDKQSIFLVDPQLPRAGLGNMLLVWARAVLFAHINNFAVIAPNWDKFLIGPYLRREKDKRFYGNLFSNKSYFSRIKYLFLFTKKKHTYYNPEISNIEISSFELKPKNCYLFIFNQLPHWSDYFVDLKEYQPIVKQKLFAITHQSIIEEILKRPAPEIGIHVRMGDFRVLKSAEDFNKLGGVRTPFNWFIRVIEAIRHVAGYDVPVTLFSDGYAHELKDLLLLPNVFLSPISSALSDMITLSRSKILITSSGSTFSYWASYLGQCPTIYHPAHFHAGVFSHDVSQNIFEGGFDPELMTIPNLLLYNIKSLTNNLENSNL